MLIRCESCGKLFDYDKQDGQCPGCGAFAARPAEPAAAPQPAVSARPAAGGVRGTLRRPAFAKPGSQAGSLLLRVMLVLLGLLFFTLSGMLRPTEAAPVTRPASGVPVQAGETVTLAQRPMTFSQPQRLTGRTAGLPEGWQLYRVRVNAPELTDWNSHVEVMVSLYAGGGYWEALADYDLESLWPDLAEQALSLYDLTGWDALDGWLYLAGPADEGATLCLEDQVLDDNYDAHTRSVTTLELNWEEASDA